MNHIRSIHGAIHGAIQRTIHHQPGRYAGWPANYGMWAWGDEIVLGFTVGALRADQGFHARDKRQPFVTMQARSMDGGLTWQVQPFPGATPGGRGLSADEHMLPPLQIAPFLDAPDGPKPCPGRVDFTHPDCALMAARSGLHAGARSWFYLSEDRCRTWQGPYALPNFGQTGVAARTDYLVDGPAACTLFLTAAKPNGQEGRVFCARTQDGGQSVRFVSWVTPEPTGYTIMPASVRLPSGRVLSAVRCREASRCWIDLYASDDNGATWRLLSRPVADTGQGGNPPTLTHLKDGRLCITYGLRRPPLGVYALLSEDAGVHWSDPQPLRTGAGNHDIGYPRTVQRADGRLITAYYWNDNPNGERSIEATIWRPGN